MLDAVHRQKQFERVLVVSAAVLPAIVREDRAEGDAQRLIEGQDAVVEQVQAVTGIFEVYTFAKAKGQKTSMTTWT
jgi:hypothetical protein